MIGVSKGVVELSDSAIWYGEPIKTYGLLVASGTSE